MKTRSALLLVAIAVILASSIDARADALVANVPTAFFYGPKLPAALLSHFDRVVVEADHFDRLPASPRAQLFAYVSVGEVNRTRPWRRDIPPSLYLGGVAAWGSDIVDTRRPEWRTFLLDRVIEPLWAKGYRGFFFDTLDSYERTTEDPAQRDAHARGIAAIAGALKDRHPDAKILFNRGFESLPYLTKPIDGLVAESLLESWDANTHRYVSVSADATQALRKRLDDVHARLRLPVSVIDYAPPDARRGTARRILSMGYEPWVTSPELDAVGVGSVEVVPRKILMLYKSNPLVALATHDAVVLIAPVLEYMGYTIDYVDVRAPMPDGDLTGEVAGIVVFAPEGADDEPAVRRWINNQMDRGIRIAFLEGFGFDPDAAFLARLGLVAGQGSATAPVSALWSVPHFGFEAQVRPHLRELPPVLASDPANSLLRVTDAKGASWDGALLARWGGAVFAPYMMEEGLEEERRFIVNPFRFLKDALALPALPVPDVTTESGRRILTVHIDGDAFVSRAERRDAPFCGQVILDEVLKKYPIPHTVSVIEGEVGPKGMYPQDSPKLEAIARSIFALPNVEIGTHLYSHPFDWHDAEAGLRGPPLPFLPVPNYVFDLNREIQGSIDYINGQLAPPGKKVALVQWSGDCLPSARAVGASQDAHVLNVNGGGATRTNDTPSLSRGSGIGLANGPGVYQVFAPVENENVYTNDWRGPFYGYRHVIQTFQLNETPRRLSTISIYYHFYSGSKTAALEALHEVYRWALQQETTPLYMSEYAAKVLAFQKVTIARRVDGTAWEIAGYGDLKTVRLDAALGWPDVRASTNVAGVRDQQPEGRYVHLAPGAVATVVLAPSAPSGPFLDHANGKVLSWKPTPQGATFRVAGHMPLSISIGGVPTGSCTLNVAHRAVLGVRHGAAVSFELPAADTGEATLDCR